MIGRQAAIRAQLCTGRACPCIQPTCMLPLAAPHRLRRWVPQVRRHPRCHLHRCGVHTRTLSACQLAPPCAGSVCCPKTLHSTCFLAHLAACAPGFYKAGVECERCIGGASSSGGIAAQCMCSEASAEFNTTASYDTIHGCGAALFGNELRHQVLTLPCAMWREALRLASQAEPRVRQQNDGSHHWGTVPAHCP